MTVATGIAALQRSKLRASRDRYRLNARLRRAANGSCFGLLAALCSAFIHRHMLPQSRRSARLMRLPEQDREHNKPDALPARKAPALCAHFAGECVEIPVRFPKRSMPEIASVVLHS